MTKKKVPAPPLPAKKAVRHHTPLKKQHEKHQDQEADMGYDGAQDEPRDGIGADDPRDKDRDDADEPRLELGPDEPETKEGEPETDPDQPLREADPDHYVGLDASASGVYTYVEFDNHDWHRVIMIDNTYYEHCATDADGVWLYRNQQE